MIASLLVGAVLVGTTPPTDVPREVWDKSIVVVEEVVEKPHLTPSAGVFYGISGKETYYNLDMSGVVAIMRNLGYSEEEYPYWVREDGCKMLGDYIMVACELNSRPRGTVLETSLGMAIVCDTGAFVYDNPSQIDIAVTW